MSLFDLQDRTRSSTLARPGAATPDDGPQLLDRLRLLFIGVRRRPVLFVLGVVAAGVFGFLGKQRSTAVYRTEAIIEVAPIVPHVAFTGEEWRAESIVSFYDDYVRTLCQRANARDLMLRVVDCLQQDGVAWLPAGVPPSSAGDHLRARVQIRRIPDTHMMSVTFEDADPELLQPVVQKVVDVFLAEMERTNANDSQWKLDALAGERQRLEQRITDVHARLKELADVLGSAMPSQRQNLFLDRINALENGRTKVRVEAARAEGVVIAAAEAAAALLAADIMPMVEQLLEQDPTLRDARTAVADAERASARMKLGLTEKHPDHRAAVARVQDARSVLASLTESARKRQRERLLRARRAEAAELLQKAKQAATAASVSEKSIDDLMGEARQELREYGEAMQEGSQLRDQAEQILISMRRIDDELERVRVESHAPSRTRLASAPFTPRKPVKDRGRLMAAGSAFLAIILLFALIFVLETLDHRVGPRALRRDWTVWELGGETVASWTRQLGCRPEMQRALLSVVGEESVGEGLVEQLSESLGLGVAQIRSAEDLAGRVRELAAQDDADAGTVIAETPLRSWMLGALRERCGFVVLIARTGVTRLRDLERVHALCAREGMPVAVGLLQRDAD